MPRPQTKIELLAWETLYQRLKLGIEGGLWEVGARLPTIDEIEEGRLKSGRDISNLKATRHNARIAFRLLARDKLAEPRGKAGTIVIRSSSNPGRPKLVALITPAPSEFVSKLTTAISDTFQSHSFGRDVTDRFRLLYANAKGDVEQELRLLPELAQEADAMLVLPSPSRDDEQSKARVQALWKIQKPIWLIAASINDGPLRYDGEVIAYPESTIAGRVTAFIRGLKSEPSRVFVVGEDHLEALRQRSGGIAHRLTQELPLEVTVLPPPPNFSRPPEALGEWIASEVAARTKTKLGKPALVVCTTDLVAFGVLNGFRKSNPQVDVPGDVMVMGVDDHEFAKYCNPRLTSLLLRPDVLGRMVALRVVAKLSEPNKELPKPDLNPTVGEEVTARESTGAGTVD